MHPKVLMLQRWALETSKGAHIAKVGIGNIQTCSYCKGGHWKHPKVLMRQRWALETSKLAHIAKVGIANIQACSCCKGGHRYLELKLCFNVKRFIIVDALRLSNL